MSALETERIDVPPEIELYAEHISRFMLVFMNHVHFYTPYMKRRCEFQYPLEDVEPIAFIKALTSYFKTALGLNIGDDDEDHIGIRRDEDELTVWIRMKYLRHVLVTMTSIAHLVEQQIIQDPPLALEPPSSSRHRSGARRRPHRSQVGRPPDLRATDAIAESAELDAPLPLEEETETPEPAHHPLRAMLLAIYTELVSREITVIQRHYFALLTIPEDTKQQIQALKAFFNEHGYRAAGRKSRAPVRIWQPFGDHHVQVAIAGKSLSEVLVCLAVELDIEEGDDQDLIEDRPAPPVSATALIQRQPEAPEPIRLTEAEQAIRAQHLDTLGQLHRALSDPILSQHGQYSSGIVEFSQPAQQARQSLIEFFDHHGLTIRENDAASPIALTSLSGTKCQVIVETDVVEYIQSKIEIEIGTHRWQQVLDEDLQLQIVESTITESILNDTALVELLRAIDRNRTYNPVNATYPLSGSSVEHHEQVRLALIEQMRNLGFTVGAVSDMSIYYVEASPPDRSARLNIVIGRSRVDEIFAKLVFYLVRPD